LAARPAYASTLYRAPKARKENPGAGASSTPISAINLRHLRNLWFKRNAPAPARETPALRVPK
jgi:hypothetical protein